jgi:hypothetical protein
MPAIPETCPPGEGAFWVVLVVALHLEMQRRLETPAIGLAVGTAGGRRARRVTLGGTACIQLVPGPPPDLS